MDCLVQFCHSCHHLEHQQSEPKIENSVTVTSHLFLTRLHARESDIYIYILQGFCRLISVIL